jgi:hypothetical protein
VYLSGVRVEVQLTAERDESGRQAGWESNLTAMV